MTFGIERRPARSTMRRKLIRSCLPPAGAAGSFARGLPASGSLMAEVNVKQLLKGVVIFKDLDDEELDQIAEVCKPEDFNSGEYIFREGESGNRLYLVLEGEVRISRNVPGSGEERPAGRQPGGLFGGGAAC